MWLKQSRCLPWLSCGISKQRRKYALAALTSWTRTVFIGRFYLLRNVSLFLSWMYFAYFLCCFSMLFLLYLESEQVLAWELSVWVFNTPTRHTYPPVVLCRAHTLTYMFTALGLHIWCASLLLLPLLLLKRPNLGHKLPVFPTRAAKTTNWCKGLFLLKRNEVCIIISTLSQGQILSEWGAHQSLLA